MLAERRRIMVVGAGGAGKSTFARALADLTGLPLIHLDRHDWKPGWMPTPPEEWEDCVRRLSSGEAWIIDGNYGGTLSLRVQRCDAIVFFDVPRVVCVGGILSRWLTYQFKPRPDLPDGCQERLSPAFIRWVWEYPRRSRPRIEAALQQAGPEAEVVRIRQRGEARAILNAIALAKAL
jgi:adenylate kinase family enzyme